ncbi:MAG: nucleoside:proton symporter [Magnetococcales bacterium]|nr:nucleoside:proton symporter [Magnetococcales bacterium]
MGALQGIFGFFALLFLAWLFRERGGAVRWRPVVVGVVLQWGLGWVLLRFPLFQEFFFRLNDAVLALGEATRAGTGFVFGYLGGGDSPFSVTNPGGQFILAFQALPLVLVVSALSALLFYWRILPLVVNGFSWILGRTMGVGGALGLAAAVNVFVGMVEAPLMIRPYLARMSRGEIFAVMTCGMATIAGTMMVLYAAILGPVIPDALGHILVASLLSAPAALTIALLMVPEETPPTAGRLTSPEIYSGSMDAVVKGTEQGVQLLIQIVAMLVVLVALVALVNGMLGWLPTVGGEPLSLQRLLGWIMAPVTWLMGVPWREAATAGALMGTKTMLNEFVAYLDLAKLPPGSLELRSRLIMTYAMCGFANFGSLGIMIGGMGGMVPERRDEIVALGMKSILAGTLATCLTGAVVGVVVY